MNVFRRIGLGLAFAGLTVTGCAPGASTVDSTTSASGGSATSSGSSAPSAAVTTDPTAIGKATITVLDPFTDDAAPISNWMTAVETGFMAKYPDITVVRKSENSNDINSTLRLRLSDASAPDVVPANQGWSGVGDLSAGGLLLNLDDYAAAYGWDKSLPETIRRQHMASTNGDNIGTGSLFGVPVNQGSFITVFYNRAAMSALGLKPPTTLTEFESQLAAAKAAGVTPIQLGTQDQSASATLLALQDAYGDIDKILDFVYATAAVALSDTGMVQAADTYRKWAEQGYFPADYTGITIGDASQKFVGGEGLFFFYYSGFLPFADQANADQYGTFVLPRGDGKPVTATGSSTQNFSIAKNSKSPAAAALFLNYVTTEEAGRIAIDNGLIPVLGEWKADTASPSLNDGIEVLNAINADNGYVPYFDWATPSMLDTLNQQLALLLDGQIDGAAFTAAAQANYDAFRAGK